MENRNIKPLILIFGILTFFIFAISFSVFYITENSSTTCGCNIPAWVMPVSLSSLGLFVGLITYYILSTYFTKEKKIIRKEIWKILDLLEKDEKKVIKHFIENNGEVTQSSLSKKTRISRVKVSRIVSKLENKGLIEKEKQGMTNKLTLVEELRELSST